ncbi:hypothetical protein N8194_01675, partial [Akkermansiaceae bacterium]|nr:hypothetical protein [Akkermansiaceae bacterium]
MRDGSKVATVPLNYREGSNGIHQAQAGPFREPGEYQIRLKGDALTEEITTNFRVVGSLSAIELAETTLNKPLLENVAKLSGGVAMYRKTFTPPALTDTQELHLHFDGVYMNSEVFLNGTSLGTFPYGYLSFSYELTPHLIEGENRIDVRVDNSLEPSARWYHPCGIYAPVTLKVLPKSRIEHVFITTPEITADSATVKVATQAPAGLTLSHTIL